MFTGSVFYIKLVMFSNLNLMPFSYFLLMKNVLQPCPNKTGLLSFASCKSLTASISITKDFASSIAVFSRGDFFTKFAQRLLNAIAKCLSDCPSESKIDINFEDFFSKFSETSKFDEDEIKLLVSENAEGKPSSIRLFR